MNNGHYGLRERDGARHEPSKVRYAIIAQPKPLATVFTQPRPGAATRFAAMSVHAGGRCTLQL